MKDAFAEQIRALIDGGVDVLLIETIIDTLSAKAALLAAAEIDPDGKVPIILSATITDRSGRTLSGQTIDAFWVSVMHAKPLAVGINCALGAREMRPYLAELSRVATTFVSSYPNAGLPNAFGQYDQHAPETGELVKDFADSGFVNIVGGCCGTTPDHIRAIAEQVASVCPAEDPDAPTAARRSSRRTRSLPGLEVLPDPARQQLPDDRRAHERDRLEEVSAADQGRQVRRGRRRRARAGARRRQPHRRQHGRGPARLRAGDDALPQPDCDRAGDLAAADHDRQLEVVGARGRVEVRAGQARRQFDQPEGRRRRFPEERRAASSNSARASS